MDFKKIKLRLNQTPFRNVIRVGSHLRTGFANFRNCVSIQAPSTVIVAQTWSSVFFEFMYDSPSRSISSHF
jgi:hypothetical protein